MSFGKNYTAHLLTLKRRLIQFGGWGYGKKLVKNNVCRKVLKVILNMHNIIKSYVMQNDDISGLFTCDIECAKGKIYLISSSRFPLQI